MSTVAAPASRILGNSAAIIGSNVMRRALGFIASVCIARYLPVEQFGRYVLVLAMMELFRSVADFGIDLIVVRRLARGESLDVVRSALKLKLATASAAIGCALALSFLLGYGPEFMGYLVLASLGMLFNTTATTLTTFFQATLSMWRMVPVNGAASVLLLVLVWIGITLRVSVAGLLAATAVAEACGLAMSYMLVRRAVRQADTRTPAGVSLRSLLAEAAPLGLGSILVMSYFRLDTIVLAKTAGEAAVGLYGAVFRITEGSLALAAGVAATFLPVLSGYFADPSSRDRALALYERGFKWLLAYGVLVASAMTVLAEPVMRLLYGIRYEDAAPDLAVLIWSTLFMSLNLLQGYTFVALGRMRALLGINAVVLIINLILILTLIPRFGLLGACAATVATEGANTLMQRVLLRPDLPGKPLFGTAIRYGGLAAVAVALRLTLGRSVLVSSMLGATMVCYGSALLAYEARSIGADRYIRRLLRVTAGAG